MPQKQRKICVDRNKLCQVRNRGHNPSVVDGRSIVGVRQAGSEMKFFHFMKLLYIDNF